MTGPVLGIDYGTTRLGIAVSDALGVAARPHGIVAVDGDELDVVAGLCSDLAVTRVVVGLPTTLAGHEGPSAQGARRLAAQIGEATGLPVEFADERFSTRRAEELLRPAVADRRERRTKVDAVAASVLLQGWLDAEAAKARGNPRYTEEL